ncbi:MAG: DUF3048 domain-containing protein [Nocardioides sp.]|nr:DUF3048 domain-containing protein [Nocardioides sp.]
MRARPARPRRASRALALGVGSVAATLVLAACGSNEPAEEPEAQETEDGTTLTAQWPLTGLPVDGELPKRPVMVVKVDNSTASAPQVGLGSADLVAEELVEGGATRLAAFFHSKLPRVVGPVRSSRATDIGVVKPTDGVLVASGGAPATVNRLRQAKIRTVTEGGPGYSRAGDRSAPYNLMMNLRTLAKEVEPATAPAYLPWSEEGEKFSGRKATSVDAQFSPSRTTSWSFARGGWTTTSGFSADGDAFRPDTLLVLRVRVGDAGYRDPGGNPVPETKLQGRGQALVFHGGEVVRGTWKKGGPATPIELRTKKGPLTLPPGKVWMGLVPTGSGDVRF